MLFCTGKWDIDGKFSATLFFVSELYIPFVYADDFLCKRKAKPETLLRPTVLASVKRLVNMWYVFGVNPRPIIANENLHPLLFKMQGDVCRMVIGIFTGV